MGDARTTEDPKTAAARHSSTRQRCGRARRSTRARANARANAREIFARDAARARARARARTRGREGDARSIADGDRSRTARARRSDAVTPRRDARGARRGWRRSRGLRARWIGRRGTRARGAGDGEGGKADDRDPMAARWEVWARDETGREEPGLTTRARLKTVEINAQCLKARNIFPS